MARGVSMTKLPASEIILEMSEQGKLQPDSTLSGLPSQSKLEVLSPVDRLVNQAIRSYERNSYKETISALKEASMHEPRKIEFM